MLIDHEYHGCELAQRLPDSIREWLIEQFGPPGTRWYMRNNSIYFESKLDHMMFLMRVS